MHGVTIPMFFASIANPARLGYCKTLRLTGRRWLLSISYSLSFSLLSTLLVAVLSGITGWMVGSGIRLGRVSTSLACRYLYFQVLWFICRILDLCFQDMLCYVTCKLTKISCCICLIFYFYHLYCLQLWWISMISFLVVVLF